VYHPKFQYFPRPVPPMPTDTDGVDEIDPELNRFEQNRSEFADDPYRPAYHFVPPGGILHDPNGACYWNGRYHVFYQFWPPDLPRDRPWDQAMHWGHATSDDLLHWRDLPVALAPDPGPERSCFSGQALVEDDRVVLIYHGPGAGNCVATADGPLLREPEKHPENPVIPIEADAPYRVFDPDIWRYDGTYYSLSGSYSGGERGVDARATAFLFRSTDIAEWEYVGRFVDGGFYTDPGEDCAVPNFTALDGTHALVFFSHPGGPQYYLGEYDPPDGFDIESHGRINFGPTDPSHLHAPSVTAGPDGRRIAFFNVRDGRHGEREDPTEGWAGVLSLPRVLGVEDGRLSVEPPAELERLRDDHRRIEADIPANEERVVAEHAGRSVEVAATVDVRDAREVGLTLLRSPDGAEAVTVSYWPAAGALGLDTSRSTLRSDVRGRPPEVGPLDLADGESLRLRVFVDRSIVEVFAHGRQTLTARVYPERTDSDGVRVFARGGSARLESMDVWEMESIWT